jgi:hypothetical protein
LQSELTFYRNPSSPILGTVPSTPFKMPGAALSASSIRIYPSTRPLLLATWVLVWDPNAGAAFNAVRLVSADDGPTNLQQIAFLNKNQSSSPIVQAADITTAIQSIMSGQVSKQILMQTAGDSQSKIYRSTIDLVWGD